MNKYEVGITCYTEVCPNYEENAFNVVTFDNEEDMEMFCEQFGHGAESEADYCPKCKQLGVAEA